MLYRWRESSCCNANKNSKHHCQLHPDNEWGIVVEDTIEGGVASLDLCQVLLAEKPQKKKAPKDQEAPEPVVDTQVGKFCGALKTTTVFKDCLVTNFFSETSRSLPPVISVFSRELLWQI